MKRRSIYTQEPVSEAGRTTGGNMLSMRTHYPAHVARALHALAERRPPWPEYVRERARILEANR